jgi:very-short-patch-repair endonuclease
MNQPVRMARLLRRNETWAEELMWRWLRDRRFAGFKFRRQHLFGECYLDFFCLEARLDIEVDGFQHGFPKQQKLDGERDKWLERAGIKVLRFWNSRLRRDEEVIKEVIWRNPQERMPRLNADGE